MSENQRRDLISTAEAMQRLHCRRTKFYDLINTGKIKAYRDKDGGRTWVDADSIDAYQLSMQQIQPRAPN